MKSKPTACALCVVALTACGGHRLDDLERYVAALETLSPPALAPLPEFAQPAPAAYQAGSGRSPFEPPTFRPDSSPQQRAGGIAPDFSRARRPLEAFPASALGLVGTITTGAVRRGLVVDADGGVHEVRIGDYLGEDHGRVRRVGEAVVDFVEILPDGAGGWVERNRSLALAEAAP